MSQNYVKLDGHKASIVIGVRNEAGKLVGEAVIETKAETVRVMEDRFWATGMKPRC